MTRVKFEDHWLDTRTRDMIVAARVRCAAPIVITQGSYSTGVSQSAGTHSGGGAVDIRAVGRTDGEREEIVKVLRWVGFAAWLRTPQQGDWPYHVHAIAIGCTDLSSGARNQVTAYKNGRNGLRNNSPDTFTRAYVDWTWERYAKTYPNLLTEDELSAQDVADIKAHITNELKRFFLFLEKPGGNIDQQLAATEAVVKELVEAGETDVKNYMAAVSGSIKDYVRQTDDEAGILAAVNTLTAQVATLTAKVEALPKA